MTAAASIPSSQALEPGIYLNMPAATYHADSALGSTSLKEIALDATEWQWKRLHAEDMDNPSIIWGRALHARVLEGESIFKQQFVCKPTPADYPGALITMDDLRKHAKSMGLGGFKTKAEAVALIRDHDMQAPIWDEIEERFAKKAAGLTIIDPRIEAQIETAANWMQADAKVGPLMKDGTFNVGAGEVSIFYVDHGVRLKARLDRLISHAIVDIKSFRTPVGWQTREGVIDKILGRVIGQFRYDLQAAAYIRAMRFASELFKQGRVFNASPEELRLLQDVFAHETWKWIWVLVKNAGAPQTFVREFQGGSVSFAVAQDEIDRAIDAYRANVEEFGPDADWRPHNPAGVLTDGDFPLSMGM